MKKIFSMSIILLFAMQVFAQNRDYNTLHNLLIKFYGYQRSGLASGSCYNLNSNFTSAAYGGDNYNGNPLDGGWYDAGDYIKFGMNLSYSVYCLLKGYDVFPGAYGDNYSWSYGAADQVPDILNEVKFATDYMMKAVINENTVVLDVGNANAEHSSWSVPSGGGRSGGQIYLCTGADIPATYAACLACMSTLYRKYDAAYADKCLEKAKVAFTFAKNKIAGNNLYCQPQGTFYDYTKNASGVYQRQINDRMVAAGVELYRASNAAKVTPDPLYKTWAQKSITDMYNCIGYAYIGPLASFEVWRQGLAPAPGTLLSNVSFIETRVQSTGTFANVYQNSGWGTARDVGTAAFEYALACVATTDDGLRTTYKNRAAYHVDWVAGYVGARSYICGVNNGPTSIHYRTTNYGPVPGAVVAGPNDKGDWNPSGSAYQYTEVAIDYNAAIVGAVAFLKAGNNSFVTQSFSASAKSVDLTSGNVVFKAGFASSVAWTLKILGNAGSKTYTGTGTTISQAWDGSADDGFFVGGESVIASLTIDKEIPAMDILKVQPVGVSVTKGKAVTVSDKDKLIDNFEDNNVTNQFGGKWEGIGTGTGLSATTASASGGTLNINGSINSDSHTTFAGVKTTFNASGTPVNLSAVTSVVFDLWTSTKSPNVSVELVQSNIKDSAYWSAVVPVTSTKNSYRVSISKFKQPDWKTSSAALDLSQISALRFTIYDSTGIVTFHVDNVYLENYSSQSVIFGDRYHTSSFAKPVISNGSLIYRIPKDVSGESRFAIYNVAGKTVMKKAINAKAGEVVALPISSLSAGMYTLIYETDGVLKGDRIRFMCTK